MIDLTGHKEKIGQLIADMNCSKDFQCSKSGFNNLCKAKENRIDGYADCLEYQIACEFKVYFGYGVLCRCPLRVYIAKNME